MTFCPKLKPLFYSKTLWINIISIVYVLATNHTDALSSLHLNGTVSVLLAGIANIINRILFTDSKISGVV